MKKALSLSLTLMAAVLLTACGNKAAEESSSREESSRQESKIEASRSKSQSKARARSRRKASESREKAESRAAEREQAGEKEVAGLGQEYAITMNGEKYYAITITHVSNKLTGKAAADVKKYADGKPKNAIEIKWTYKNYGKADGWKPDPSAFTVYDDKNTPLTNRSLVDNVNTVGKGKSAQATSWFVLPKSYTSTKYIRITYRGLQNFLLEFKIPLI